MTFEEQMVPALSVLLETNERLNASVYGTLLQKRAYTFGYFGLTDRAFLVSLLQGDSTSVKGTCRIPLSTIRQTQARRSILPMQHLVTLHLTDGTTIKLRISRKVFGFSAQAENLDRFLDQINAIP